MHLLTSVQCYPCSNSSLQKLFLNIHVDKIQDLSDLSREELLVRINENGALHGTDRAASDPAKQHSTSREFYPLPEEGSDTCRQADMIPNEFTDIGNVAFHPLQHARCPESSTISTPGSPLSLTIATIDASLPAFPTDARMASRRDQAIERIVNICDYFIGKADNYFEMSLDEGLI